MKKNDTKTEIRIVSFMLLFAVLAVWVLFYFIISNYIADNTKKQMTFAAEQIIERLSGEFSQTERLSYGLTQNADVIAFWGERDSDKMFSRIGGINKLFGAGTSGADFVDSIVLFGADRSYHRLAGILGNKECTRLADAVFALDMPSHLSVELNRKNYIGYADEIRLTNGQTGAVVVLIEEEKILEAINAYDQSGALMVAVRASGEIITANTGQTDIFYSESKNLPVINSKLGITPYEITVVAQSQYMNESIIYFTIVAIITAIIITVVIFLYIRLLNKRFFRPMVSVIGSIEKLETSDSNENLPHVQSEEFDGLVDKINEVLLHSKNAEIDKQKALVHSLKKQINAHFTINTLEAIRSLVEQENFENAVTTSSGLIHLIRYAYDKDEFINIWREFGVLQNYMFIMNTRYGGKIDVDYDFDDRLMNYIMPRMILQPIIENAIQHGFKYKDEDCKVSIIAGLHDDSVCFNISDNGRGMSEDELAAFSEKLCADNNEASGYENIALLNIRNRLFHYYGNKGQLAIRANHCGGVCVEIIIPAEKDGGISP
jgi:sensor histidine kinase YesM